MLLPKNFTTSREVRNCLGNKSNSNIINIRLFNYYAFEMNLLTSYADLNTNEKVNYFFLITKYLNHLNASFIGYVLELWNQSFFYSFFKHLWSLNFICWWV